MKKVYLILTAAVGMTITSCTNNDYLGDGPGTNEALSEAINFGFELPNVSRAGELSGATAAEKLGGMFVVEGTKGEEQTNSPSTTVVFDNYLVGYEYNSAGKTESNTKNWEYVGKQTGIADRMTGATWTALHSGVTTQSIKYWDYSTTQYDFIAWSTGTCEAIATGDAASGKVKVTRINTGTTLKTNGFSMTAVNATDLSKCYYTDINKVLKANYGVPVTLTFRNMAAKVRVAFYETVPGYSVKDVEFYTDETTALTADVSGNEATLYTPDGAANQLPQSGTVTVMYPRIGTSGSGAADYNKASVTVSAGSTKSSTQTFGTLPSATDLGTTLPTATFAGDAADAYYQAVIPNTDGKPLTLRVNYTLVSTDGSTEEIKVYGAKAVVPATYTNWLPNYAYTYIFKISDNSNGWTDTGQTKQGLVAITFDAVVTSFVDANAEQTTVTTVATPSITTYQQGHNTGTDGAFTVPDEYNNDGKKLYVKVMNGGTAVTGLSSSNSLLFEVSKADASEAEVMDALQYRTNTYDAESPVGRNGITLTAQTNGAGKVINNTATSIVNGVNNQPITVSSGEVAEINLDGLEGTYAYVYVTSAPDADEEIYNVVNASVLDYSYYQVELDGTETPKASGTAAAGKVYFVKNVDAEDNFVSYTFKQTKVGDDVTGLVEATIPGSKAGSYTPSSAGHYYFYFDVYNKNNGAYAVKVIKIVD